MLAVAETRGRAAWYLAAALAGLRKGDMQRLTWADVDFDQSTITIRDGKARREDVLPMHPQLAEALKRQSDASMAMPTANVFPQTVTDVTRRKDFLRAGIAREEVVTDRDGQPVMIGRGKNRRPRMRIVSEDAEGRVIDLHAMRTTLGTNLARAGVAPQIAQRIMRHSDYRTTLRHYTVLGLSDTAKAVEALPAIRTGPRKAATGTGDAQPPQYPQQYGRETARVGATPGDERGDDSSPPDARNPLRNRGKSERTRPDAAACVKAGERTRTVNIQLGRLTLYH